MFRYLTAGETHGKALTVIIDGFPAGLEISANDINAELARRQLGYGRGARMRIEKDTVEFAGGVRLGQTTGAPICLVIKNLDWQNWQEIMAAEALIIDKSKVQTRPRPGHADLVGVLKYDRQDIRDILERSSARETASKVAAGALCKKLLAVFDVSLFSFVKEIGGIKSDISKLSLSEIKKFTELSVVRTPDKTAEKAMISAIDEAKIKGDTLGGIFSLVAQNVPLGLGSHTQWDKKLDAKVAAALMAVQAIKGVEFGAGFSYGSLPGSIMHDEIYYSKEKSFYRKTNNAGGFEGGMTNGEDIFISCVMKPIPSLAKPLSSVDIKTKKTSLASLVRGDVCAVPAAGVVGEAVVAIELASAFIEKFGGDTLVDMKTAFISYKKRIKNY
ncbi:MAG: chorismate synthase [Endomicrobiales bacterium]|nr:chorismate synthase [Endomicrobiales bacterium]